jgi:hypothetical protein
MGIQAVAGPPPFASLEEVWEFDQILGPTFPTGSGSLSGGRKLQCNLDTVAMPPRLARLHFVFFRGHALGSGRRATFGIRLTARHHPVAFLHKGDGPRPFIGRQANRWTPRGACPPFFFFSPRCRRDQRAAWPLDCADGIWPESGTAIGDRKRSIEPCVSREFRETIR